jgi:hypothetical protein
MTEKSEQAIRTFGTAEMTESGIDVYAFHLHRYLAEWLEQGELDRMYVTVGFEHSACQAVTFELRAGRSEVAEVGWDFDDLCHAYRSGDGRIRIEQRSDAAETLTYEVVPILDRPATGGAVRVILGFLLLPEIGSNLPQSVGALQEKVGEALRAARRNGVRMFFDDRESRPIKPVIYELMDHLPEWFGCDHSASMLMTSTLETMALNASKHGRLDVLAERLYMEEPGEEVDRLVGMSVLLGGEEAGVLEQVVARQLDDPELPYQIYERGEDDQWRALADDGGRGAAGDFHRLDSRPDENVYVFVPLKVHDGEETELLGFLCMAYRDGVELSSSGGQMLANLGERLSAMLRYSPLYTLSAQKLWVLRRTRDLVETALTSDKPADRARDELIEGVSSLIAHQGAVPSFAVGYLDEAGESDDTSGRVLRYVHPHGWTHFEDLTLPVDVPDDELAGSGVSALAARVGRPLVLAGGRGEGETQQFKNYLYIDEENQRVVDARNPRGEGFDFDDGWRLLSHYYKPARWRSYATLAYPITFGGEVLGVVTIEVEKETDWVWWTGFGGQLFWEMLADELGTAMSALSG